MMQVGMGIFRTRLEGFFGEIFSLERKMLCGKCCWSQLFKALHVDSCWGDGETADLHFSVRIECFVMDNLVLFSLFFVRLPRVLEKL